jgi:glycosyltransferase involved in cell wall biosynthesis
VAPLPLHLAALGAEVENRWIADHEVRSVFSRHDAVALPHIECSQSGVAAAALGCGLPLIGSRVGGLTEQLRDGETGVVAETADAAGLAAAIRRLAGDRKLYAGIRRHIQRSAWERSMRRFAEQLVGLAIPREPRPGPGIKNLAWV